MLYLEKRHDPSKNAKLIEEITGQKLHTAEAIRETELMLQTNACTIPQSDAFPDTQRLPFWKKLKASVLRFLLTEHACPGEKSAETLVDEQGNAYPAWKAMLDEEYTKLQNSITRHVNVEDFGAVGDGVTDCTEAFKKAIGHGKVFVSIPSGVFVTKGITIPSRTCLVGSGKGATTIKLHEHAPKGTRLLTNKSHWKGNSHISIADMSLNWNVERLGTVEKTSTWGNHSSCLTFANVTFGWVKNVEAINPGLHGFDISSTLYNYSGDGYRARGGSEFIWLDQLNGYGFGDDGITTHHSKNILISNSHMCDPSGRAHAKGFSNSNGIEIDDGSQHIWLINNSTTRCFGGIEIKAHGNSSAANNVQIIGHVSVNDNRSYNFRHIEHHKSTDPQSKTAFQILATNIVALAPIFTDLYAGSTPRGLVVSAYKNVAINYFTLIGDPNYDYCNLPVIALQYRCRHVSLNHLTVRHFKKAGVDINVFGGANHADNITISSVSVQNSAPQAIHIGKGVLSASIDNLDAVRENGQYALKAEAINTVVSNVRSEGYKIHISLGGKENREIK